MPSIDFSDGYNRLTDIELVEKVQLGDDKAICTLIGRYRAFVQSLASRYYSFSLETEDIVQEGMLALLLAAYSYSPLKQTAFRTYSAVCISNRIRSLVKRQTNNKNIPLNQYLSLDDIDIAQYNDPADLITADENTEKLFDAIQTDLSDLERKVLNEIVNGSSYREAGEKLGITEKSVNNALQRLRNKLKIAMNND